MSQTLTAGPPTGSTVENHEILPTTSPLAISATSESQALSYAQPVILATYFYLRFGALVADPIPTLLLDLAPVAVVQALYAIVCLPVSKRHAAATQTKSSTTPKGKASKKPHKSVQNETPIGTRISNALIALFLACFATVPIFVLFVLFGAPLTTHHAQTLLCAAHFSILAVFPLFYTHGVDKQSWWEIGGAMLPFDSVWGTSIGCILGAWLGAVPIPLDWDREWQKWPVTIVAGIYAGATIGNLAGRYLLFGKRLKFTSDLKGHTPNEKKTS